MVVCVCGVCLLCEDREKEGCSCAFMYVVQIRTIFEGQGVEIRVVHRRGKLRGDLLLLAGALGLFPSTGRQQRAGKHERVVEKSVDKGRRKLCALTGTHETQNEHSHHHWLHFQSTRSRVAIAVHNTGARTATNRRGGHAPACALVRVVWKVVGGGHAGKEQLHRRLATDRVLPCPFCVYAAAQPSRVISSFLIPPRRVAVAGQLFFVQRRSWEEAEDQFLATASMTASRANLCIETALVCTTPPPSQARGFCIALAMKGWFSKVKTAFDAGQPRAASTSSAPPARTAAGDATQPTATGGSPQQPRATSSAETPRSSANSALLSSPRQKHT